MARERKSLPIARRGSNQQQLAPSIQAVDNAMELARYSPETADYLVDSFKKSMDSLGKFMIENSKGMLQKLENYRDFVSIQNNPKDTEWSGVPAKAGFQNFQDHVADKAAEELTDKIQDPIKINFAVSNASEFIRGFSAAGNKLPSELNKPFDQLINGFFAENDLVNKGSTLYKATEKGTIKQVEGIDQKADPIETREKIEDGLAEYFEEKGISATVIGRTHPADRAEVKKEQAAVPETTTPERPSTAPRA